MFYDSISKVYDFIFPQNPAQLKFIQSIADLPAESKVLDIGCATGNLTALLSKVSDHVIGLDLDDGLLEMAHQKHPDLIFKKENMLNIDTVFKKHYFDTVVSFGNTLVHLPNRESVQAFFTKVYKTLKDDGDFIVQIINYDRIVKDAITSLATIDNDVVKFVRDYQLTPDKSQVAFKTELTIKTNGQVINNSIDLLTLGQEELETMLSHAGFNNIQFYGSLNGDSLTENSVPLLFSCKKRRA